MKEYNKTRVSYSIKTQFSYEPTGFFKIDLARVFGLNPYPHPEPGKYRVQLFITDCHGV